MSDDHLTSLEKALALSPDNVELRMLLVEGYEKKGDLEKACSFLSGITDASQLEEAHQLLCARVTLAMADPSGALKFLVAETPACWIERARSLFMLDRMEEARELYDRAIQKNPALEDRELHRLVEGKETEREKNLADNDTEAQEMNRLLQPEQQAIRFEDVGGLDGVKTQIRRKIITPFLKPSLFQKFKRRVGGGILLYGPPGCGKTMLARATAGECKARFFNVVISDILDMYIGESEQKLHQLFEAARQDPPAVIFFDEVEALASKRQHTREGTSSKLISQFLSELDGFAQNNQGVLVLAATNVPWALDPAFRRPGRFDRVMFIPPPDEAARRSILEGLLKDRPGAESIQVSSLAKHTSGFSGADLSQLIEAAVDEAIDRSIETGAESPLEQGDFKLALEETHSTVQEWLTTARNHARYSNEGGQYNEVLDFLSKHSK